VSPAGRPFDRPRSHRACWPWRFGALTLVVPDDSTTQLWAGAGAIGAALSTAWFWSEAVRPLTRIQVVGLELRAKDVGDDATRRVLNALGVEFHAKVIELRDDDGIPGVR
jgi:hypothetical protein